MHNDQTTEVTKAQPTGSLRRRGRRTGTIVLVSLFLLAIVALVVLHLLGYFYAGVKTPAQRVAVGSRVCGESIITEFNTRTQDVSYPMNEGDKAAFSALKRKIASTKGNEDDPTCQTMLFQIAYTDMDVPAMDAAYKHVQASYDKGVYADSNLLSGYHPNTMKSFMNDAKGN